MRPFKVSWILVAVTFIAVCTALYPIMFGKEKPTPLQVTPQITGTFLWAAQLHQQYQLSGNLQTFLQLGNAVDSLILQSQLYRDSLQERFYHQLAMEVARKETLSWRLLYGIWMRESKMNPLAKGDGTKDTLGVFIPGTWRAFGLGQIHLPTARVHYDKRVTKERLMDPLENAFASGRVLKDYIVLCGGDERYGISAYQQGPVLALAQYKKKELPKNWEYVSNVLLFAARAD